jgi:hypothetical protein
MTFSHADFHAIAAVNDDEILRDCLQLSPDIAQARLPLTVIRGAASMAEAYNRGLAETDRRICVFIHQDVYLPSGWLDRAVDLLNRLEQDHPQWMVAGPYGVQKNGSHTGRVWDVNMGCELGEASFEPTPVESLDELLLILKREAGFRFDPGLPHFHLYGTDLVQSALAADRGAFAVELPVVHNNRPYSSLAGGYVDGYRYARRKWRHRLPIFTTICAITYNPIPLWRAQWRRRKVRERPQKLLAGSRDAAQQAGYEAMAQGR